MQQLGQTGHKLPVLQDEKLDDKLRWYFMTPLEQRGTIRTWKDLSEHVGVEPRVLLTRLHARPEVASDILQWTAIQMGQHIPKLANLLLEAAEAGSIRAIEIYLDHVRKTITDERLISASKGIHQSLTVNAFITNIESSAAKMLATAKAMSSNELAPARGAQLRAMVAVQDVAPLPTEVEVKDSEPVYEHTHTSDTPPRGAEPPKHLFGAALEGSPDVDHENLSQSLPSAPSESTDVLDLR